MGKLYLFIFLSLNSQLYSQKSYSFDFLTKYKSKITDSKKSGVWDNVNYFNSDDFNYYLRLFKRNTEF